MIATESSVSPAQYELSAGILWGSAAIPKLQPRSARLCKKRPAERSLGSFGESVVQEPLLLFASLWALHLHRGWKRRALHLRHMDFQRGSLFLLSFPPFSLLSPFPEKEGNLQANPPTLWSKRRCTFLQMRQLGYPVHSLERCPRLPHL